MKEADYLILYHFNLSLGVFSHFAPDVIHKNSKVFAILLKIHSFTQQGRCKLDAIRAGGLYKGSTLCETFHNKSPGCKPIGVVFKALREPKLSFQKLIE